MNFIHQTCYGVYILYGTAINCEDRSSLSIHFDQFDLRNKLSVFTQDDIFCSSLGIIFAQRGVFCKLSPTYYLWLPHSRNVFNCDIFSAGFAVTPLEMDQGNSGDERGWGAGE